MFHQQNLEVKITGLRRGLTRSLENTILFLYGLADGYIDWGFHQDLYWNTYIHIYNGRRWDKMGYYIYIWWDIMGFIWDKLIWDINQDLKEGFSYRFHGVLWRNMKNSHVLIPKGSSLQAFGGTELLVAFLSRHIWLEAMAHFFSAL